MIKLDKSWNTKPEIFHVFLSFLKSPFNLLSIKYALQGHKWLKDCSLCCSLITTVSQESVWCYFNIILFSWLSCIPKRVSDSLFGIQRWLPHSLSIQISLCKWPAKQVRMSTTSHLKIIYNSDLYKNKHFQTNCFCCGLSISVYRRWMQCFSTSVFKVLFFVQMTIHLLFLWWSGDCGIDSSCCPPFLHLAAQMHQGSPIPFTRKPTFGENGFYGFNNSASIKRAPENLQTL